jgi:hypothetical protein
VLSVAVIATPALVAARPAWAKAAATSPMIPRAMLATRLALAWEADVTQLVRRGLGLASPASRLVAVVVAVSILRAVAISIAVTITITVPIMTTARGSFESRGMF